MKHYHLTKTFVKLLIVADIIFFSAAFINLSKIKDDIAESKAEINNSCDLLDGLSSSNVRFNPLPPTSIDIDDPLNLTVEIDQSVNDQLANLMPDPEADFEYRYELLIRNTNTDKNITPLINPDGDTSRIEGNLSKSYQKADLFEIYFPSADTYSIKIQYYVGECDEPRETMEYPITVKNGIGTTTLKVDDNLQIAAGRQQIINFNITGNKDARYYLSINVGGEKCPASSTEDECWSQKLTEIIPSNNFDKQYQWDTSGSILGGHQIKLKVYNSATGKRTGMDTVTVYVCKPELIAEGKCVGDGSDETSGSGGSTGDTPSVDSSFNFTLKSLFGGKDMTKIGLTDLFSPDNNKSILSNATKIAIDLAGVVAIIMILWASIIYATSYGEESKAEMAKKTLTWSVIGLIVIIFSRTIYNLIEYYL